MNSLGRSVACATLIAAILSPVPAAVAADAWRPLISNGPLKAFVPAGNWCRSDPTIRIAGPSAESLSLSSSSMIGLSVAARMTMSFQCEQASEARVVGTAKDRVIFTGTLGLGNDGRFVEDPTVIINDLPIATAEAQTLLNNLGFNAGPADGKLGPLTQRALTQFRRDIGQKAGTNVDLRALSRLRAEASKEPVPEDVPQPRAQRTAQKTNADPLVEVAAEPVKPDDLKADSFRIGAVQMLSDRTHPESRDQIKETWVDVYDRHVLLASEPSDKRILQGYVAKNDLCREAGIAYNKNPFAFEELKQEALEWYRDRKATKITQAEVVITSKKRIKLGDYDFDSNHFSLKSSFPFEKAGLKPGGWPSCLTTLNTRRLEQETPAAHNFLTNNVKTMPASMDVAREIVKQHGREVIVVGYFRLIGFKEPERPKLIDRSRVYPREDFFFNYELLRVEFQHPGDGTVLRAFEKPTIAKPERPKVAAAPTATEAEKPGSTASEKELVEPAAASGKAAPDTGGNDPLFVNTELGPYWLIHVDREKRIVAPKRCFHYPQTGSQGDPVFVEYDGNKLSEMTPTEALNDVTSSSVIFWLEICKGYDVVVADEARVWTFSKINDVLGDSLGRGQVFHEEVAKRTQKRARDEFGIEFPAKQSRAEVSVDPLDVEYPAGSYAGTPFNTDDMILSTIAGNMEPSGDLPQSLEMFLYAYTNDLEKCVGMPGGSSSDFQRYDFKNKFATWREGFDFEAFRKEHDIETRYYKTLSQMRVRSYDLDKQLFQRGPRTVNDLQVAGSASGRIRLGTYCPTLRVKRSTEEGSRLKVQRWVEDVNGIRTPPELARPIIETPEREGGQRLMLLTIHRLVGVPGSGPLQMISDIFETRVLDPFGLQEATRIEFPKKITKETIRREGQGVGTGDRILYLSSEPIDKERAVVAICVRGTKDRREQIKQSHDKYTELYNYKSVGFRPLCERNVTGSAFSVFVYETVVDPQHLARIPFIYDVTDGKAEVLKSP